MGRNTLDDNNYIVTVLKAKHDSLGVTRCSLEDEVSRLRLKISNLQCGIDDTFAKQDILLTTIRNIDKGNQ